MPVKGQKSKKLINWFRRIAQPPARDGPEEDPAESASIDPYNPFPEPVEIELGDVLDLHTIPPRDVSRVVEEYLSQAYEMEFPVVRIIHGKGIGVQQRIVLSILERTTFVADWTVAPPEAGGLGATMVRFKR